MAQRRQNSTAKKKAFLSAYARTSSVTKAARLARIDRDNHYDWKSNDPEYAAAFEAAREQAAQTLEDEAIRRANEGVRKPIFQGGQRVGFVQEYSDTLLIFLLKGIRPDKYRERISAEHTGPGGGPIQIHKIERTVVDAPNSDT